MSRNGKVIVAMSGGVDSSVAAVRLREQGYECIGVFLRVGAEPVETPTCTLPQPGEQPRRLKHGCCSATDALDARLIAGKLGIPFYALNFRHDFERIIDYFADEYASARTPNPCVMCNIHVKFGRLFEYADLMDAEFIATGHYARTIERDGRKCLARAVNRAKDQSYVLFGMSRDAVARCLFPLGDVADKAEVRAAAEALGLHTHDKPDSQEICFVPDQNYARLVRTRRPDAVRPGEIVDQEGRVLGHHDGLMRFTIGQRRRLGFAAGRPLYVTRLDVLNNRVVVGDASDVLHVGLIAGDVNWLTDPPAGSIRCDAKIRHMHTAAPATLTIDRATDSRQVRVEFDTPQSAVTPGQAAVFYDGDVVLGGGWIRESLSAAR
jgi:tRNA-specific 2-thiouridylase